MILRPRPWFLASLASTLLLLGLTAFAQTVPRLVLPQIDGLIEPDGSGSYQKVLSQAAQEAGVEFTADVYPRARALALFLDRKYDGIFTFTQTARDKFGVTAIVAGYPLGAYRGYVFRAKGRSALSQFTELSGRIVGGVVGFDGTYGAVVRAGAVLELVNDDSLNLAKLRVGRLDAMLGFLPDLYNQLDQLSFDPAAPFFESFDRLTLFNSPENRLWLEKISVALKKMHTTGAVAALVGPSYLPVVGNFPLDK